MVIDCHGHTVAPPEVYAYQATLLSNRGNPDSGPGSISDERLEEALRGHLALLDRVRTDMQLISPRPYHMMNSIRPPEVVLKWVQYVNDIIARQVRLHPDRFRGVAGLPQTPGDDLVASVQELERCVKELGFVGCLLNPDPTEGQGTPPGLGDEYWYPLYAKLVELDVPALVHSTGCVSPRESYTLHFINEESIAVISLLDSPVFEKFPTLKIIVGHGGGAIPYHMGRFQAWRYRTGREPFEQAVRRLYYDTCTYSGDALQLLFTVMGADRCLFGTEKPGTGSAQNPHTGQDFDDLKPVIENLAGLTVAERQQILYENAMRVFRLQDFV